MSKSTPSFLLCKLFCVVSSLILICLSTAAAASVQDDLIESQSTAASADGTGFDPVEVKLLLLNLKTKLLESRLEKLVKDNSVPLGFVYTQLPNQFAPDYLWPACTWMEVTLEYQGLFFRAEGGGSAKFGLVQEDSTRQISQVQFAHSDSKSPYEIDVPKTGWSQVVQAGFFTTSTNYDEGLRFNTCDVEVRPKNTAVRIWKRIL